MKKDNDMSNQRLEMMKKATAMGRAAFKDGRGKEPGKDEAFIKLLISAAYIPNNRGVFVEMIDLWVDAWETEELAENIVKERIEKAWGEA